MSNRQLTPAIMYRLIRYADHSAIALVYTETYGKQKLFVPRAFGKKGGIVTFIPGTLDFGRKESSDLHKFYGFTQDLSKYSFINDHRILLRLHLVVEVLDALYEIDQEDPVLYRLLLKFTADNCRSITPYTLYYMLVRSGLMFSLSCTNCDARPESAVLSESELFCPDCATNLTGMDDLPMIDARSLFILRAMGVKERYAGMALTRDDEMAVYRVVCDHVERVSGRRMRSLSTLMDMD